MSCDRVSSCDLRPCDREEISEEFVSDFSALLGVLLTDLSAGFSNTDGCDSLGGETSLDRISDLGLLGREATAGSLKAPGGGFEDRLGSGVISVSSSGLLSDDL